MKNNKKGFTLIEILAVIIIMGVLMLLVVPAVTKYIHKSKMDVYTGDLQSMITSVKNEVISGDKEFYEDFDSDYEYLVVPLVCIDLEKGSNKKSTFGEYLPQYSFVLVEGNDIGYSFKVQALDDKGYGTALSKYELIKISEVNDNALSYITRTIDDDGNATYGFELKNYNIPGDKSAYVLTCDAITNVELPSNVE